jgi:hypothetical protein
MFLHLLSDKLCMHLLDLLRPFDSFWDWYGILTLFEFLDRCIDPFLFLVPTLDLWILLQPCPNFHCFIEQFNYCTNLLFYLLQLCCFFLLPFLLHCWWSGWCELFSNILDILLIFLDSLLNMIDLFFYWEFIFLCSAWDFLKNSSHSSFQFIPVFFFLLSFELGLLTNIFQCFPLICCLLYLD